jgi:anti-anti-sigma factor
MWNTEGVDIELPLLTGVRSADMRTITITLHGEIDLSNAQLLQQAILAMLDAQHSTLVLDCQQLKYCDSSGLSLLINLRRLLVAQSQQLELIVPKGNQLLQLLAITGLDRVFVVRAELTVGEELLPATSLSVSSGHSC